MVVLKYLLAFVVLSVVILIHEFGHFIIAKASGVVVEEFSLGMGPRLLKFTRNGTMYSLKAFLFGGSCRMKGDEDENDTEGSFNAAPIGKRIAIILAGPIFNFILAFVLSVVLFGIAGYDPAIIYSVTQDSPAEEAGLQAEDQIVAIDGSAVDFYGDYTLFTYTYDEGSEIDVTVLRDGEKVTCSYTPEHIVKDSYQMGVYLDSDAAKIVSVVEDTPAYEAGLLADDEILSVNGIAVSKSSEISPIINAASDGAVTLQIRRTVTGTDGTTSEEEKTISFTANLVHSDYYDFGFYLTGERIQGNPITTIAYSFKNVGYWIKTVFMSFKLLFTGKVSANDVSGPVGIVSAIGDVVEEAASDGGLYVFLNLVNWTIMISANLGVMNLLPIPALDGGRFLFLLIELVRRKPISKDKEGIVNLVGFVLLMILMVVILFNDIRKFFVG